jgi:SAM-dependent methyltransferase
MLNYTAAPIRTLSSSGIEIESFITGDEQNIDHDSVQSFGEEWSKFSSFSAAEIKEAGDQYFDIVNEKIANADTMVLDVGCGTGRWSKYLAPRVKFIEAIDPSDAVFSAAQLTKEDDNIRISHASVDRIPFADASFDLVFSLGVLHHIPDTQKAMEQAVAKVKPGGYFLVYLYYALDGRGAAFKALFRLSILFRKIISKMPSGLKKFTCDVIAIFVYMPFIALARFLRVLAPKSNGYKKIPLSYYADKSWNIIRNDALDRFGTPLEQRFTKQQIVTMMEASGLNDVQVSDGEPYWHALGKRK